MNFSYFPPQILEKANNKKIKNQYILIEILLFLKFLLIILEMIKKSFQSSFIDEKEKCSDKNQNFGRYNTIKINGIKKTNIILFQMKY